jgi:hypothetical protein
MLQALHSLGNVRAEQGRMSFDGDPFRLPLSKLPQLSPIRANKDPQFTTSIAANAQSANFQDKVGTASLLLLPVLGQPSTRDNFADFNCFKDDNRVLYTDANFGKVYSLYYCQFANRVEGAG